MQLWLCYWALLSTCCPYLQAALGFELGCSRHVPVMLLGRQNNYQGGCYSISLRSPFHRVREGSFPTWQPSRIQESLSSLSGASAVLRAGSSAPVPTHPPERVPVPHGSACPHHAASGAAWALPGSLRATWLGTSTVL